VETPNGMLHGDALGLLVGAVVLGAVHGVEPGHGWPVAASYALDRSNEWAYGFAASLIIGVGHLVSSIAMVGAFFYAKGYFDLARMNEPITVFGGVRIGGPISLVAGILLIGLGIREYRHGHHHGSHEGEHGHGSHEGEHGHGSHEGEHGHGQGSAQGHSHADPHDHGIGARLRRLIPFGGGGSHSHDGIEEGTDRGLLGIAWFAFVLGFAHEEEFEIIALCTGSAYCLELMTAYAVTVVIGIVGVTMLLIAGYRNYEDRVERITPYLPVVSAVVLVGIGLGFILGVF
jgi:ABC-type nickel/cobalt efflux system permease component RcnA